LCSGAINKQVPSVQNEQKYVVIVGDKSHDVDIQTMFDVMSTTFLVETVYYYSMLISFCVICTHLINYIYPTAYLDPVLVILIASMLSNFGLFITKEQCDDNTNKCEQIPFYKLANGIDNEDQLNKKKSFKINLNLNTGCIDILKIVIGAILISFVLDNVVDKIKKRYTQI
jgi:hypothetical protein